MTGILCILFILGLIWAICVHPIMFVFVGAIIGIMVFRNEYKKESTPEGRKKVIIVGIIMTVACIIDVVYLSSTCGDAFNKRECIHYGCDNEAEEDSAYCIVHKNAAKYSTSTKKKTTSTTSSYNSTSSSTKKSSYSSGSSSSRKSSSSNSYDDGYESVYDDYDYDEDRYDYDDDYASGVDDAEEDWDYDDY